MAMPTVRHSPDGVKPDPADRPAAKVVPLLGPQIDHLFELRDLIRRAQDEERRMTAEILGVMEAAGLTRLAGQQATAIVDRRATLRVDPELFHRAVGGAAYEAMSVSVGAARPLVGEADLGAISEATTTPVLRLEPVH
jgi:hypothetical protein